MHWSKTRNGLAVLRNGQTDLNKTDEQFFKIVRSFWLLALLKTDGVIAREK